MPIMQAHPEVFTSSDHWPQNTMILELFAHIARMAESAHFVDLGGELRPTARPVQSPHASNHLKSDFAVHHDAALGLPRAATPSTTSTTQRCKSGAAARVAAICLVPNTQGMPRYGWMQSCTHPLQPGMIGISVGVVL